MYRNALLTLIASFCLLPLSGKPTSETAIMPLSEIEPGMMGTWRTVVNGQQIDEFNFKVLGVAPNFAGPNSPVIIAEALDESQILSGPVGGMSGSPCYIDGKMIGAYAYGFLWPKEQSILGITPIEEMLKVFDKGRPENNAGGATPAKSSGAIRMDELPRPSQRFAPSASQQNPVSSSTLSGFPDLKPAPTPLIAGGFSSGTLDIFRPYSEAMGLQMMSAPSGTSANLTANDIEPGSPVAGVMLDGDFSLVATGTCTWREGDQFLAFGHPFLQGGPTEIPVAPAEIITVIRSLSRSFKLSNAGPIVGTIYQDRLTAIAGEVGQTPQLTKYQVNVTDGTGQTRSYSGNLFQNEAMGPYFAAIGLYDSATSTLEAEEQLTYYLTMTAEYEGHEPLVWSHTVAGNLVPTIFEVWDILGILQSNPFEEPNLTALTFDLKTINGRESFSMDRLQIQSGSAKAGKPVEFSIRLKNFREEPTMQRVRAPIPKGTEGETLSLFIGDYAAADRIDDGYSPTVSTFGEMLDYFRTRRDNQKIYVKLLRKASGYRLNDQALDDLPPSARSLLSSKQTVEATAKTQEITLWETTIDTPGAFAGSYRFTLPVEN